MKAQIFSLSLAVLSLAPHAWAQQRSLVDDFLARYEPSLDPVSPPPATLQEGNMPLPLQEVVAMMLGNSLDVRANRLSPQAAMYQTRVLHRTFQPGLRVAWAMNRSSSPSNTQLQGAPALSQLRNDYQVGFTQQLEYGTTLSTDFSMNRVSSNSTFNTYNPSFNGNIRYTVVQKLLRDRGKKINTRQIRVSQNNQKISEIQFEIQLTNLLVQAQRAYWDLVFAGEDLKVKQRSLDLATRTLEENKMKVEIGTLAPIDVVQTETEVASRREQLLVSTFTVQQTEDQIKRLISSQSDPGEVLTRLQPTDRPMQPLAAQIPAPSEAIRVAIENRPELRQNLLDLQNREMDVAFTQNQRSPQLDLTAAYTQSGLGGNRTERSGLGTAQINRIIPGGVGGALRQIFAYDYTGYSVGFSLNIPLNNSAANADHDRAMTERRLSQSRMDALTQQIALEVRNALSQVELNRARIETAQKTRELSERRLEAEQTKFQLGTSTLRFVLEEQRNVAQAQTNEIQAMINFTKALVDLDRSMGLTLRRNNVEVEKALNVAN